VPADTWARPDGLDCWDERGRDLDRFQRDYRALNRTFNPVRFNPGAWADAAKSAGMRYVCYTTKHHDGFCMWDTTTTDYRITHSDCPFSRSPHADTVREVFDAFRDRGMAISAYFSKSDWHVPYYWSPQWPPVDRNPNYDTSDHPEIWARFVEYVHAQVRELMTDYGEIDCLWLDGGQVRPPKQDIDMAGLAAMARELQPGLIIADRTVGGEHENFITPEQRVPEKPVTFPWESCVTLASSWKYSPGKMVYKPASEAIHLLIDIVAKGGNLLLGIGPTPEGTFDDVALSRLAEIGAWMDVNGDGVYGTRPVAPYAEGNLRFTQKGDTVYVFVLDDGTGAPAEVTLRNPQPGNGAPVRMLGLDMPLACRRGPGRVVVSLPRDRLPCDHAWCLAF